MLSFFRHLLNLYPAAYRREYGEEMLGVLIEVHSEVKQKSSLARAISYAREAGGLLRGALREHARTIFFPQGFPIYPQRRPTMRSEYKFPKATVGLMTVILGVVLVAIEKAKAISESVAPTNLAVESHSTHAFLGRVRVGVASHIVRGRDAGVGSPVCPAPLWHTAFFGPESFRQPALEQRFPRLSLGLRLPQTDSVAINVGEPRKRSRRDLHRRHQRLASKRFRLL